MNTDTKRILVVDDEEMIRDLLEETFSKRGYEVETAVNGREALKKIKEERYDLLVTDLRLPDISGMEILSRVKGKNPELGTIMITAYGSIKNAVKAMKNGGTLRVELQEEKFLGENSRENVAIVITDSGEGMSKKVMEKLFTPFFTTRERGLGLGLSLAQNFISLHRGNIFVESEKGIGSTVTIVLPKNSGSN